MRCYISRVENGHTVRRNDREAGKGDDIPLYQFLCDIDELPEIPNLPNFREREATDDADWGNRSEEAHMLSQFRTLIARVKEKDPLLLLSMAQRMAAGAPCGQG